MTVGLTGGMPGSLSSEVRLAARRFLFGCGALVCFALSFHQARATDAPVFIGYTDGPLVVSKPHGGAFVISSGTDGTRVASLTSLGTLDPAWPPHGLLLGAVLGWTASSDLAGGLYVVGRLSNWIKLFRFTSDGSPAIGWPDTGLVVGALPISGGPSLFVDQGGAVYVAWQQTHRNGTADPPGLFLTRILPSGLPAPGWTTSGTLVSSFGFHSILVGADGVDGVNVVWLQESPPLSGVGPFPFATRFLSSGARAGGWPAGGTQLSTSVVPTAIALQVACSDGSGGALVAWNTGNPITVRMTRVSASGARPLGWPADGLEVASGSAVSPSIASDGAGGAFATWHSTLGQVFLQRVSGTGFTYYVAGGTQLSALPVFSGWERVGPDGQGGAYVTWRTSGSNYPGDFRGRITRVTEFGDPAEGWSGDGLPVGGPPQNVPAVVPDSVGGAYVAWDESHPGPPTGTFQTWFRHVLPDGSLPSTLDVPHHADGRLALTIAPRPARTLVNFTVTGGVCSRGEVLDALGRVVRSGISASTWDLRDDGGRRVPSGIYFLRAMTTIGTVTGRFVVIQQ